MKKCDLIPAIAGQYNIPAHHIRRAMLKDGMISFQVSRPLFLGIRFWKWFSVPKTLLRFAGEGRRVGKADTSAFPVVE
jgi:hypothetical protein